MKLLIVGMDGADYQWCHDFMPAMPNLAKMQAEGVFMRLESLELPSTPPCWFSAITGATPEEHRIQGFRMKAMQDVQRPPFWEFLDCPVGVVGIPLVYYAGGKFRGFIVPGFHAPMNFYPPDLQLDGYVVSAAKVTHGRFAWLSDVKKMAPEMVKKRQIEFLALQQRIEEERVVVVGELLERFDVDVLFVGILLLDRIGHGFAHHKWTMQDAYKTADSLLGELIRIASPETVVVFSDHGMDVSESPRIPPGVVESNEKRYIKSTLKVRQRGMHTRDGIFAAIGKYIQPRADVENAELRDIAPTVLAIMGEYRPNTMSGTTLDIFPVDEDPRTVEMLRGLGYL